MALCGDDELDYLASRTQFGQGQGLLLDESYRLAHLPLVAPDHPRVIARREGRPYEMGRRHERVFSLVLPIADELLRRSSAYLALEAELKASPIASKIAWNIVERRRHKLHATICSSLATGETPVLDGAQRAGLRRLGPVDVELRGLFSGNVNQGRLYLRVYPEKRDGLNVFHHVQQVMGRRLTSLYVVGLYNLVDDLDASECSILSGLLARWWERPIVRFQVEALCLLGATDDLVLDPETAEMVPLI